MKKLIESWKTKRRIRKLKKLVVLHNWIDAYMLVLGWSRTKRRQFWRDFVNSRESREENLKTMIKLTGVK